jgi:hypothetical protein
VRAVYVPLKAEQDRLIGDRRGAAAQLGLALEDSIFEPRGGLGALRPEAIAAAPLIALSTRDGSGGSRPQAAEGAPRTPPTCRQGCRSARRR